MAAERIASDPGQTRRDRAWELLTGISTRRVKRRHAAWWSLEPELRDGPEGEPLLRLYLEAHTTAGSLRRASGWVLPRELDKYGPR